MAENASKSVVFIHGAWMIPACWDNFRRSFQAAGYTTTHRHGLISTLHRQTNCAAIRRPVLVHLGITEIVDRYQTFITPCRRSR